MDTPLPPDSLITELAKLGGAAAGFGVFGYLIIVAIDRLGNINKSYEALLKGKDAALAEKNEIIKSKEHENKTLRGENKALVKQLRECRDDKK